MRGWTLLLGLGVGVVLPYEHAMAQAQRRADSKPPASRPYEGLWAPSPKACRDEDGVDRMEITGDRFFWYETRCRALAVEAAGRTAWALRMSCEGEGQRFRARPRLSLPAPGRLVMDGAPVGPTKRQVYVRCARPPERQ